MKLTTCVHGHLYDQDRFSACPVCGHGALVLPLLTVPERFRQLGVVSEQGRGATSTVWRIQGSKVYALKQIHCVGQQERMQALHEIAVMERLQGVAGVVHLLDTITEDPASVWLLQPYMKPFSDRIREADFTADKAVRAIMEVLEALTECARRGVMHLDVQPKNLFVNDEGRTILGDFGTALFADEAEQQRAPRGTLAYMAPEVYRAGQCSMQSDLCSLGLVLYGLFNEARLPFMERFGDETTAIYKRLAGTELPVPAALAAAGETGERLMAIIRRMCAFQPDDRYPDAMACHAGLEAILPALGGEGAPLFPRMGENSMQADADCGDWGADFTITGHGLDDARASLGRAAAGFFDADRIATSAPQSDEGPQPPNWFDADALATSVAIFEDEASRQQEGDTPQMPLWFDADALATTAAIFEEETPRPQAQRPFVPPAMAMPAAQPMAECRVCGRGLTLGAVFCHYCGSRQQLQQASVPISRVSFSAIAPKTLVKGEYSMINIMMYEESFRHVVDEVIRDYDEAVSETKSGTVRAKLGARVLIRLTSPDLTIEDGEEEREWAGDYLQFGFAVMLPEDYRKRQVLFTAQVYVDGVIATRLKFTARCFSLREQKLEVMRSDVLSAFVSYASADRARVASIVQGMQKARPDMDIFFDVETLRSGQNWEKTLYSEIERRDVLYLCWSQHASESPWVRREWEYAYETKGEDSIEPIPIDPPDECPPPEKLAGKHFNDKLLYLMKVLELHKPDHDWL